MRHIIIVPFLILLFSGNAFAEGIRIDCDEVEYRLELYFENPTPRNANSVCKLLPVQGRALCTKKSKTDILETFLSGHEVLTRQMMSGDEESINLAIKWLVTMADGFYAEEIDIALGKIITAHPDLLLTVLKCNSVSKRQLGAICVNTGEIYMYQEEARCVEMRKRYQAISNVGSGELSELKSQLLSIIGDDLKRNCK